MPSKYCDFCAKPLERKVSDSGETVFFCLNSTCQALRLSRIESRLESIERLLTPRTVMKESISPKPTQSEVSMKARKELETAIEENIQTLPTLSLVEGKKLFFLLLVQFNGSRAKLYSQLEQTANQKFFSIQFLPEWAILMAYSGKPFFAAQRILREGNSSNLSFLQELISRANSVRKGDREHLPPHKFYLRVLDWARSENIPNSTLVLLRTQVEALTPASERVTKPPELPTPPRESDIPVLPRRLFEPPSEEQSSSPPSRWTDRFRPEEGWEFAIGANWLRWVGIGAILLSIFAFITWSSAQLRLTEEQISMVIFVSVFLAATILHLSSFLLLRMRESNRLFSSIGYSFAFLAIGIYFLLMFALRFHPSSPFLGDDQFYMGLSLLLILVVGVTAQRHNARVLFIEGFSIAMWLIWHLSSQIYAGTLSDFSLIFLNSSEIVLFSWLFFAFFLLIFLGVAYLRQDMVFTTFIQILSLALLFLPNSSNLLTTHIILNDINAMVVVLVFLFVVFLFTSYIFPLAGTNQFFGFFAREHLSISSVIPVFASFFLLRQGNISGTIFLPVFLIFTTAFVSLAFHQKDLDVAFLIVLFVQIFWFLSIGTMEDISFFIPEVNGTLVVLVYLTFFNWLVARDFPSDAQPRFWDVLNRKHLSLTAIGPIFLAFFFNVSGYVTNTIFIIYLVLFCILWSSNRDTTVDIPSFNLHNVSMFDFVTYLSAFLFLLVMLVQPGDDLIGLILGFIAFPFLFLISQNISRISINRTIVQEVYAIINSLFMALLFLILVLNDSFTQFSEVAFSVVPISAFQYGHNWAFLGFLWVVCVLLITAGNFRIHLFHDITKFSLGLIPLLVMHLYLSAAELSESMTPLFVIVSYAYVFVLYSILDSVLTRDRNEGSNESWFIFPLLVVLQVIIFLQQIRTDSPWYTLFVICSILYCILWSTKRDTKRDISRFSVKNISIFDFVTYLATLNYLLTVILNPNSDFIGLILGFIIFPLLLLVSQNISHLSIDDKTVQEVYAILNSLVMAILFFILVVNDSFVQLSELVYSIIPLSELNDSHNLAFLVFLWIICVLLITTINFRTFLSHDGTKLILGFIPLVLMQIYLSAAAISESMMLVFVMVCYGHVLILYFLFETSKSPFHPESSSESRFALPLLAVLQIIVTALQIEAETPWNMPVVILVSLVLPFSIGYLLIIRKQINHLVDSYLLGSTSVIAEIQFFLFESNNPSDGWLLHTVFLGFSLVYILVHLFRVKNHLLPKDPSSGQERSDMVRLSLENSDYFGFNLLLLSLLGFTNTLVCFNLFGTTWPPLLVFLFFDLVIFLPLIVALLLFRIQWQTVVANALIVYGTGLLLRLLFIDMLPEFDYIGFLLLVFLLQVIIHTLLFWLSVTVLRSSPFTNDWYFDFTTRESWNLDSFKLMAILNPLIFYLSLFGLVTKSVEISEMPGYLPIVMVLVAIFIGSYNVVITRINIPRVVTDCGLFFSILIVWGYTLFWPDLQNLFYFSAGATAFLCILYGFWVMKREWRVVGLIVIGVSIVYSAFYLTQLTETLQTIVGFGLLGIISIGIGLVYSKFASRFEIPIQSNEE